MRTNRRFRRALGVTLMTGSIALATALSVVAPAGAQSEEPETRELTVEKTAYYTTTAGEAIPDTLSSEFPPGAFCVVAPELCPDELSPVYDPLGDAVGETENIPTAPQQPVPPGTLPVGIFAGNTRYQSAMLIPTPTDPADKWVLRLPETQPTYHSSSPAYRQAVLAAFASIGAGEPAQDEFVKVLEQDPVESAVIGVEACPITAPFDAGENQADDAVPPVDCVFGANGVRTVDDNGDAWWEFDLTFAVQGWQDGMLSNEGIFLRPAAAPNLAFGDPDTSTNAQVTFDPSTVTAAVETAEPAPAPPPPPPANDSSSSSDTGSSTSSSPSLGSSTLPAAPDFSPEEQAAQEPVVADAPTETAPAEPAPAPVAAGVTDQAGSAWWVWLLAPVFAAGMYLTAQSLTAEVAAATERQGAMSRLIAQRKAADAAGGTGTSTPAMA